MRSRFFWVASWVGSSVFFVAALIWGGTNFLPTMVQDNAGTGYAKLTSGSRVLTSQATPIPGADGGTGNAFFGVLGPTTSLKNFTFPNTSTTVLTTNAAVTVVQGGTGLTTLAQGDLIHGSAANTFSALAKDTNATRYLANTGTSNNPAWGQVNLTNGVTGTLPVANGGTGKTANTVATSERAFFSSIETGNASAFVDTVAASNRDLGGVTYIDASATDGCAYWEFDIPSNLASTPAWKIIIKHLALTGGGGNAFYRVQGAVIASGDSTNKVNTSLAAYAAHATGASPNLAIDTLDCGSNCDGTLALVASRLLVLEVCRDSDNASDTVNAQWMVKSVNVEYAENN